MRLKSIPLSALQKIGEGLTRPEGVVIGRDGRVWASDKSAAVALVRPEGIKKLGLAGGAPNGLAMDAQGRILIANFGLEENVPGPLQRLDLATGEIEVLADKVEGKTLIASNFPAVASDGSIYCTHSTWTKPLSAVAPENAKDGLVYRVAPDRTVDVVAEGLHFGNGCCFDPGDKNLFVAQTFDANVLRYPRRPDGTLGEPKPYGPRLGRVPQRALSGGAIMTMSPRQRSRLGLTDGCQFDVEGNLWVTLVMANRIVAITPNNAVYMMIDDIEGKILNMPTNIAFGGPDMRDLYIAQIGSNYILKTRSPIPGLPLAHQR